jgi:tetratricopeptide (TPR) repeat protein
MASRWQTAAAALLAHGGRVGFALILALGLATTARAVTPAERCAAEWPSGVTDSCEEAVTEDPQNLESWTYLARAYLVIGADRGALKALRSITIITPDDPLAHFNYGATAGTLRRYEIAVEELRRALEIKPDYVEAEIVLSIALEKLGRFEEAVEAKRRAARLGDDSSMFEITEAFAAGVTDSVSEGEARTWIERAANMGHIGAIEWMVDVYHEGLLGEQADPVKAQQWRQRLRDAREECC